MASIAVELLVGCNDNTRRLCWTVKGGSMGLTWCVMTGTSSRSSVAISLLPTAPPPGAIGLDLPPLHQTAAPSREVWVRLLGVTGRRRDPSAGVAHTVL